jgi:hypothetical protein
MLNPYNGMFRKETASYKRFQLCGTLAGNNVNESII